MTIIRLTAQRDQCAQVKTEYGEVVVSHGWALVGLTGPSPSLTAALRPKPPRFAFGRT